jgi:hypothetical protein
LEECLDFLAAFAPENDEYGQSWKNLRQDVVARELRFQAQGSFSTRMNLRLLRSCVTARISKDVYVEKLIQRLAKVLRSAIRVCIRSQTLDSVQDVIYRSLGFTGITW